LERRIQVTFPESYRRFLLEYNGGFFRDPGIAPVGDGCPDDSLTELYGIGASDPCAELGDSASLALFDGNDPPVIVPIGYTIMGGLIILVTDPEGYGAILLKEAYGDFFYLADGIEEFFELLQDPPPP
jgi:hypothetical protein